MSQDEAVSLTEIRLTPDQLEELKEMCVGNPDTLPMWPAIVGIPVVVDRDPEHSVLFQNEWDWRDLYDAVLRR